MTERLDALIKMNPEFAEALARGEQWATNHAEAVRGIDGQAGRRHPERARQEDGHTPQNWCGACPHQDGCIMCDLDEPTGALYAKLKPGIGKWTD